jgi:hypothetical protein
MDCRYIDDCRMFAFIREHHVREDYVTMYCQGPKRDECERYKLRSAGRSVPLDLTPDGGTIEEI